MGWFGEFDIQALYNRDVVPELIGIYSQRALNIKASIQPSAQHKQQPFSSDQKD